MNTAPSPLEQQVRRVRRCLFLQTLLNTLAWSWAGALLLSAAWFLVEPHLLGKAASWLRWLVAAGTIGFGAVVALLIAWFTSPSSLKAALVLDGAFNLKERVTTSLGLSVREAESQVGRALLADVNNRLSSLRVTERFPVRLSWSALAVPVAAVLLVLLAAFYRPNLETAQANDNKPLTADLDLKQAIEKQKKDLLPPPDEKKDGRRARSPELQQLDDENDLLAKEPTDTREQGKEFIKKTADLEQRMQDAERQIAERNNAVRDRLNQEDRLNPERLKRKPKADAAKDLQQAMKDGDFQMAQEAMDRLSKMLDPEQQKRLADKLDKLKNRLDKNGLTEEERQRIQQEINKLKAEDLNDEFRKDLQEALRDLEKVLDDLAEPEKQEKQLQDKIDEERKQAEDKAKEREEEVKKAEDQAKEKEKQAEKEMDPEKKKKAEEELKKAKEEAEQKKKQAEAEKKQAERELEKKRQELAEMKKNNQQMGDKMKQDLKDLAKELGNGDKAMQDGKDGDASKKMQAARDKLRQMMGDADRQNLLRQIRQLQLARQAVCDAMNDGGKGNGNGPANQNDGGVASGQRPLGKEGKTQHIETTAPTELGKGPLRITDFLDEPGGTRGTRGPVQMTDELRIRAAQEGASALTRQRLDKPGDTERVRGYFDNMRGPEKTGPK